MEIMHVWSFMSKSSKLNFWKHAKLFIEPLDDKFAQQTSQTLLSCGRNWYATTMRAVALGHDLIVTGDNSGIIRVWSFYP
jgi:hypothetical protein